ncbi:hypothetical protein H310_08063 [Aphanomyces invadans]|uniref:Uncharacterized protein n=1 Tax=Aphanomyces invadans TaxID=157072 RepID=A0A024U0D6_9STRA|nr:hypothetical protein H310_08063 [Aphanomyces invadans]ETV99341.1 hypothetical protein H310_08063 [Aphanomyces invadans]|eukprot:XP_008871897.1 hypothetical protein H310_08063 [Aphanomyces invadans]
MAMARRRPDTWPMVESCLGYLKEHATGTVRSSEGRQAADVVAALKGGHVRWHHDGSDSALIDPAVVWTALDLLLLDPCCNLYLFPPNLYPTLVRLHSCDDAPDLEKLKALLHSPPDHTKHRFFHVMHVLHEIWTRTGSAMTECVERFAPLLFRDGVSAVRSISHMEGMHAAKRCFAAVLLHIDFMSRDDATEVFDALIQDTVHAVLFPEPREQVVSLLPPSERESAALDPTQEQPFQETLTVVRDRNELAAVKLQALVRGWLCRRWSVLALLFRPNWSVPRHGDDFRQLPTQPCRRLYLALTKQVLLWPVDKLQREKAHVKARLKSFDKQFQLAHGRRPSSVAEKESLRQFYELYHFLGLIMDYQITDAADPSNECVDGTAVLHVMDGGCRVRGRVVEMSRERLEAKKARLHMRLVLFERHFELCCNEPVHSEDDYGHLRSSYNEYKKLSGFLAQNQEPHE